ncbi:MAG: hypothetical protein L3J82_07590 [Planctomycetes bacterium]|nr:hypothetical protein [Planctomycetota bacterium]
MLNKIAVTLILTLLLTLSCACGAGGVAVGGSSGSVTFSIQAVAGDAQVSVSYSAMAGATQYTLYYGTSAGATTSTGTAITMPTNPFVLTGLPNGTTYYAIATWHDSGSVEQPASAEVSFTPTATPSSPYDPSWGTVTPSNTIPLNYSSGLTASQNSNALETAINALNPGDKLEIGAGTWTFTSKFTIDIAGTASAPIWIYAASGQTVIIDMAITTQNICNIGESSTTEYVVIQDIEFTGGSIGIRFYDCNNFWFNQNEIHGTADAALTTNTADTSYMYITRNEIYDTDGTGEGMYLGANNSAQVMSNSIIALNYVHDIQPTGASAQGDGIELKQGSWGNIIAENTVHDTRYPCILVYGTDGNAQNEVYGNLCWNSGDNVYQIQGECKFYNNIGINSTSGGNAFRSVNHQGNVTNLQVYHNTFIEDTGNAARLDNWDNAGIANMLFANNACYSNSGNAIRMVITPVNTTYSGNVCYGSISAQVPSAGYATSTSGLTDFLNANWSATNRDVKPSAASSLQGAGDNTYATTTDFAGVTRTNPPDTGAYEN